MGLLTMFSRLPYLLFLFAGAWVDRMRRRPVLIVSDLLNAALLGTVPLMFWGDSLSLPWLYFVMFGVGVGFVFYEVAYAAFVPRLVAPANRAEANAKLQLSESVAQVGGPGIAGLLVARIAAPFVVALDAVSYLVSAILNIFVKVEEPPPPPASQRPNVFASIWQGLKWLWTQPMLRPLTLAAAFYMLCYTAIQALYFLFAIGELGLSRTLVGIVVAIGGPGAILGAWLSDRVMTWMGPGRALLWMAAIGNGSLLLVALAVRPVWLAAGMLALSQILVGFTTQVYMVSMITLRQAVAPQDMQGRVAATHRAVGLGLAPVGALAGGLLADAVGLRPTLLVAAIGVLIPVLLLVFSPVPSLREIPPDTD
jgi:predicted MFS family arabinose efflux permease